MRPAYAALAILLLACPLAATAQPLDPFPPEPVAPPAARARPKPKRPQVPAQPITVYDARIEAGDLRISGSLRKPGSVVELDEDISVMADKRGRFVFRLPYRPPTCISTLRAGSDEREVVIANCAPEGQAGPKGEPGPTGPQGIAGSTGPDGSPGSRGEPGPRGEPGDKGEPGVKGESGPKGESGAQGAKGEQGPPGEKGAAGDTGAKGEAGARGDAGVVGEAVAMGAAGSNGASASASTPAPPSPLRVLRADSCPASGCALACDDGEALVSAYCLGGGQPSYEPDNRAACPAVSTGIAGFCTRQ